MNIKILVATHKKYHMPQDGIYIPVRVGSALAKDDFGYQRDNEGENISEKNPYYCELTALYWAWKNLKADYVGLVHYRRHFSLKRKDTDWNSVLSSGEAETLCKEYDLILPKKRKLYIETVYSHYDHTFYGEQFDRTREIIERRCPEYVEFFDKHMRERSEHLFNMFIMKRELFHQYCEWLFPILQDLEAQYDLPNMDPFQARLIGRVSERLMDVWVQKNKLKYKDIDYLYFGKKNMIRKVWGFAMAAIFHKRYKQSF